MASSHVLAIDQGTTSTRAAVYDVSGRCVGSAAQELTQHYPQPGWVEHDAEEIWQSVAAVVPRALETAGVKAGDLAAIGLTNQRETSVLWERSTGKPVARALVWQDRRTADFCRQHKADEPWITSRTGLVLDPYFSATKIHWLLERDAELRARAETGKLAWGTIDSFLIWRLTAGKVHATDVSNASRTLLLNLQTAAWDEELCRYFGVPRSLLAEVRPSAGNFGTTTGLGFLPDGLPISGVAGDQQAALFGRRCQMHLRYGGIFSQSHRQPADLLEAPSAHHPGRHCGRTATICPGGECLRCRRSSAMAARRPETVRFGCRGGSACSPG